MADIFEEMGLPGYQSPQDFRMEGVRDTEEDEFPKQDLHPEVENALKEKASEGLEKAGIQKDDPRHADLLELELLLKIAQLKEEHSGFSELNRSMKIADVQRVYGRKAPQMIQALGLGRSTKKPASREELLLSFLQRKKAGKVKAQEKAETREYRLATLAAAAGKYKETKEKSERKDAHSPLNKRADTSISQLNKEKDALKDAVLLRPSKRDEHSSRIKKISFIIQMFEDIKLKKDAEDKAGALRSLENKLRGN